MATTLDPKLAFLNATSKACSLCKMCELGQKPAENQNGSVILERDPHVFSNLHIESKFMVVGQNPGWEELKQGEPFVGAAGKNFNQEITRWGLSRDDFYITNNVKCYTKSNSKPTQKHQQRCSPWLLIELATIKPKLVITLGASAFENFCPELRFGDCVGTIVGSSVYKVKVYPVYHPSPLNQANLPQFAQQIRVLCKLIHTLRQPIPPVGDTHGVGTNQPEPSGDSGSVPQQ